MLPTYRELLARSDAPAGSAWGLFGSSDEIGTVNRLGARSALKGASLVRRGIVVNLDYPLDAFDPPVSTSRKSLKHNVFSKHVDAREDWIDAFFPQASSQIDGLRHRRHSVHGFYNGYSTDEVDGGMGRLGIHRLAEHGIVGRGVLVDLVADGVAQDRPLSYDPPEEIDVQTIDRAADRQGVEFDAGDILLLRTGWAPHYLYELDDGARADLRASPRSPGLIQSERTLEWLWDCGFAMVAADNLALEVIPPVDGSSYGRPHDGGTMHQELLALLGLCIGELWSLERLAEECWASGVFEFMVVASPLNLVGGVGSPPNAVAIL